jgi:hypothetical protein
MFITYFEADYNSFLEENEEMLAQPDDKLTDDDKELKQKQKQFLNLMF